MLATTMRLLFLAPFPPSLDGTHGGSRVCAQLLRRLVERHDAAVVCLRHQDDPPIDEELRGLLDLIEEVVWVDVGSSPAARAVRGARDRMRVLAGQPLWVTSVNVPEFRRRLAHTLRAWKPDLVQIQYTAMAVHLPPIEATGVPVILWDPDPATNAAIDIRHAVDGDRLLRRLDVRAWRRFERDALRRVDTAVALTPRDVQVLERDAESTPIVRIPLGTDFTERVFVDRAANAEVLFVGNFIHPPNIDAAYRLVHKIFPKVLEAHPSASLQIVGDHVPARLLLASQGAVNVAGRVPDTVPYIERATVVAAPMRLGGGMRIKVLEALAAGKPLVASRLAVEGLDVADGSEFLAAETDADFSDRISRLLGDEALRRRLSSRARSWAHENLRWDRFVAAYEDLYAGLLNSHGS